MAGSATCSRSTSGARASRCASAARSRGLRRTPSGRCRSRCRSTDRCSRASWRCAWASSSIGLLAWDRNVGVPPPLRLPGGRVVSRAEAIERFPGLGRRGLTGAAVWHDYTMPEADRLTLTWAIAAAEHGAVLANYVEAIGAADRQGTGRGHPRRRSPDGSRARGRRHTDGERHRRQLR